MKPQLRSSMPPAPTFLRLSVGFVYFYFGFLKFFPDLSPAELIASQTLMRMSNYWLDAKTVMVVLAIAECAIGLAFLFNVGLRWVFPVFVLHQLGRFIPLFIIPEITFKFAPFAPTLEGQFIFKNLISLAAGWTVMMPAVRAAWDRAGRGESVQGRTDRAAADPGSVEPDAPRARATMSMRGSR